MEKQLISGLKKKDFQAIVQGKQTDLFTLVNDNGMEVSITNYGGALVSIMVPDRQGNMANVVQGHDSIKGVMESPEPFLSTLIGRYGNRICKGKFTMNGKEYSLAINNGPNSLHGGPTGWQDQMYKVVEADGKHIKLLRESPDGDNAFPGNVKAYVTYTLTDDNAIDIAYEATTDAPTVINMTNHSYFNLSGDPAGHLITDDILWINAANFTPVDSTFMTTGEIRPVAGTPFDFTTPKPIGQDINADCVQLRNGKGYDHNWCLDTAGDIQKVACELYCPLTGIDLKVYTDEPGVQVYTGNFLDGTVTGKKGVVYQQRSAICLETQHYPDSPNKPQWPSVVLRPGETYTSHCIFAFSVK